MVKTVKQMAEEYGNTIHKDQESFDLDDCRWSHITKWEKEAFLAGYNAAAPKWISVEERLPELGEIGLSEDILLINKYGNMGVSAFYKYNGEILVDWGEAGNCLLEKFTHWMPLPAPPKEEV